MYSEDEIEMFAVDAWDGTPAQVQIFYNNSDWTHPILMNGLSSGFTEDYMCSYHYAFVVDGDGIVRYRGSSASSSLAPAVAEAVADLASSPVPGVAADHRLLPGYPNPFNPMTTIPFQLAEGSGEQAVKLEITDVRGRVVRTLVDGFRSAGTTHEARWDGVDDSGRRMPSGTYLSRLKVDGRDVQSRLLTLVK